MARGDGGMPVFEDDKDRDGWMDLMEWACARFGWRVHAWGGMGNHFHVLLETPKPDSVVGMAWEVGLFSQRWNRGAAN
jgi:REP element-mobilizing transposase RayT